MPFQGLFHKSLAVPLKYGHKLAHWGLVEEGDDEDDKSYKDVGDNHRLGVRVDLKLLHSKALL